MDRSISPATLQSEFAGKYILDVRRVDDLAASSEQLAGANWKDPTLIGEWADSLPKDEDIVLYCVRGWKAAGGAVTAK